MELLKSKKSMKELTQQIQSRQKGYVMIKEIKGVDILTGQAAKKVLTSIQQVKKKKTINQISGMAVMGGKAKGLVVVVKNDPNLKKVKQGNILVTVFTRPHYLLGYA